MKYRVYIEETAVRLFMKTVEADSLDAADALAQAALDNDDVMEWDHSSSDCSWELRPELTEEEQS